MRRKRPRISLLNGLTLVVVVGGVLAAYRLGLQHGMGRSDSSDLLFAKVVSLPKLDALAAGRPIHYQGSNKHFHYVRIKDIGFFRLRRRHVTIPLQGFDGDGTGSVGMIWMTLTIENGQLKAPGAATGSF